MNGYKTPVTKMVCTGTKSYGILSGKGHGYNHGIDDDFLITSQWNGLGAFFPEALEILYFTQISMTLNIFLKQYVCVFYFELSQCTEKLHVCPASTRHFLP